MNWLAMAIVAVSLFNATAGISGVAAADEVRREEIRFAPGESSARVSGRITGHDSVEYRLEAGAGQRLTVSFNPTNASAYFNIFEPGRGPGDQAMYIGASEGNQFEGVVTADGSYTVQVYLYRNAARRGEHADYTIEFAVSDDEAAASAVSPDFADGLSGGPDFWRVTADRLNLRRGPTTRDAVIVTFVGGTTLRNLGCQMSQGARWCRVQGWENTALDGWVDGRYLAEAPPPTHPAGDALVPGTPYHATGEIDCGFTGDRSVRSCRFGVMRNGPGRASVEITFPDGFKRMLEFDADAVRSPRTGEISVERDGGARRVTVDGSEHFVIPDAVIDGG